MKTQQDIYDEIKRADNKHLWTLAKEYSDQYKKIDKYIEREKQTTNKKEGGLDINEIINDKDLARTRVFSDLFKESGDGNAQAGKTIIEKLRLEEDKRDISISVISHCGICSKCLSIKNSPKKIHKNTDNQHGV